MFKPFESNYKQNWAVYKFNQQAVIDQLQKKGCTGGPSKPAANNQSIFSCPNVGKLSFRFGTTTGNQLRALAFEIMQRQLKSVGIELVARFQVAGTLFGTTLPSGDWDLAMFTWVGSPSTPITIKDLYACGGDQNYMNYCNKAGTAIMNAVAGRARRRKAGEDAQHDRAEAHGQGHPVHPAVRTADLRHPREHGQGSRGQPDQRGQPLERRKLDGVGQPAR